MTVVICARRADAQTVEFSARQRSRGALLAGVFGLDQVDTASVGVLRIQWMRPWMSIDDSTVWASLRLRRPSLTHRSPELRVELAHCRFVIPVDGW